VDLDLKAIVAGASRLVDLKRELVEHEPSSSG
jgi:hypothetical protein